MKTIDLYGADWCSDCVRAKSYLESKNVEYNFIDLSVDENAAQKVQELNGGKRIIPTILIDGVPFTNPNNTVLAKELNL